MKSMISGTLILHLQHRVVRFLPGIAILAITAAGCIADSTESESRWQTGPVEEEPHAASSHCNPRMIEADPAFNASIDQLAADGTVVTLGGERQHMDGTALVSSVDFEVLEEDGMTAAAAGTLSCTINGCQNVPGTPPNYCLRSGCVPNTDKTDCTACTCDGNLCGPSCTCTRTITVDTGGTTSTTTSTTTGGTGGGGTGGTGGTTSATTGGTGGGGTGGA